MHITHECPASGRVVHLLQNQNARRGNFEDAVPEVGTIMKATAPDGRFSAPKTSRRRVSHHGPSVCICEHAANAAICKSGVPKPCAKCFDRIRDHASVKLAKSIEIFVGQQSLNGHACFLSANRANPHKNRSVQQNPMPVFPKSRELYLLAPQESPTGSRRRMRSLTSPAPETLTYRIFALGSDSINPRLNPRVRALLPQSISTTGGEFKNSDPVVPTAIPFPKQEET